MARTICFVQHESTSFASRRESLRILTTMVDGLLPSASLPRSLRSANFKPPTPLPRHLSIVASICAGRGPGRVRIGTGWGVRIRTEATQRQVPPTWPWQRLHKLLAGGVDLTAWHLWKQYGIRRPESSMLVTISPRRPSRRTLLALGADGPRSVLRTSVILLRPVGDIRQAFGLCPGQSPTVPNQCALARLPEWKTRFRDTHSLIAAKNHSPTPSTPYPPKPPQMDPRRLQLTALPRKDCWRLISRRAIAYAIAFGKCPFQDA